MHDADFALFNVNQLVTVDPQSHPRATGELGVLEHGALAARDGRIVWVGPMDEFHDAVRLAPDATVLNPHGRSVIPGFVDAHTHPVFAGNRTADFYARATGQRYGDQAESGIMHTVRSTRSTSEDALLGLTYDRCLDFLRHGITTIEAKTGYGLSRDAELKSLRVLNRLGRLTPLRIVPAFLGAHITPADSNGDIDSYVAEVISWLPDARPYAGICDTWCDDGAFDVEQCRRIMTAAQAAGFALTLHASELGPTAGVRLAVELGALSVDHAVYLTADDISALAAGETTVVLLPGTTFFLNSNEYAPARALVDAGVNIALGTDFNPGTSCTQNMQFILTLAVLKLGLTAEEAMRAATLGGARAVGMESVAGSLTPGKLCDFSVLTVDDYRAVPYHYAMNLVHAVVSGGRVVIDDGELAGVTGADRAMAQ